MAANGLRCVVLVVATLLCAASANTSAQWERVGSGRYIVQGEGNAFASSGDVTAEIHRTASQLCPSGYDIEDSTSGTKVSTYNTTQWNPSTSRYETSPEVVSKPSGATVIVCRRSPVEKRADFAKDFDRYLLDQGGRAYATGSKNTDLVVVLPRCGSGLFASWTDLSVLRQLEFRRLMCAPNSNSPIAEQLDLWAPRVPVPNPAPTPPTTSRTSGRPTEEILPFGSDSPVAPTSVPPPAPPK